MISLVVTDLDGTLWGRDLYVPKAHHQAIKHLAANRIPLLAATARRPRHSIGPLAKNGLGHLPYVCVDGSIGINDGERFHEAHFNPTDAAWCLNVLQDLGLSPVVYVLEGETDVVVGSDPTTSDRHLGFLGAHAQTADLNRVVTSSPIFGFSMFGLDEALATQAWSRLNESSRVNVVIAPELTYGGWGLVLNPTGVSKWSGVLAYCDLKGIDPTKVLTVGDGANDVEMHRKSFVAVGVRGGHPSALAVVDHVIEPPENAGWKQIVNLVDSYRTNSKPDVKQTCQGDPR